MKRLPRPSGISLPLLLKRRWENERHYEPTVEESATAVVQDENMEGGAGSNSHPHAAEDAAKISVEPLLQLRHGGPSLTKTETEELANRVFTAKELEERIWTATNALVDIQRQLYRGEEIYYEDTHNHGNIFRGWDAFVDAKDIGGSNATSSSIGQPTSRRVPADLRWFSASCRSISRVNRPMPLLRHGSTQDSGSRLSSNPTPVPPSSGRSDATTPSPTAVLITTGSASTPFAMQMDVESSTPLAVTANSQDAFSNSTPKESQAELNSETKHTVQLPIPPNAASSSTILAREVATLNTSLIGTPPAQSGPNETPSIPETSASKGTQDVAVTSQKAGDEDAATRKESSIQPNFPSSRKPLSPSGSVDMDGNVEKNDDSLGLGADAGSPISNSPSNATTNPKKKRKERESTNSEALPAKKMSGTQLLRKADPNITGKNQQTPTKIEIQAKNITRESSAANSNMGGKNADQLVSTKGEMTSLDNSLGSRTVTTPIPRKRGRPSSKGSGASASNVFNTKVAKESASPDVLSHSASGFKSPALASADSKAELAKQEKKETQQKGDTPRRGRPRRSSK